MSSTINVSSTTPPSKSVEHTSKPTPTPTPEQQSKTLLNVFYFGVDQSGDWCKKSADDFITEYSYR